MKKYATEAEAIAAMNLQIEQDKKRGIIRLYRIMALMDLRDVNTPLIYTFMPWNPMSPKPAKRKKSTRKG